MKRVLVISSLLLLVGLGACKPKSALEDTSLPTSQQTGGAAGAASDATAAAAWAGSSAPASAELGSTAGPSTIDHPVAEQSRTPDASPPPVAARHPMPARTAHAAPDNPMATALAYAYDYSIQASANPLRGLISRHERACVGAGPANCQVINEQTESHGGGKLTGTLEVRATADWIAMFRATLEDEVKAVGGKLIDAKVESEDLRRNMIDTAADIRSKTVMRDRLRNLLAHHKGKLEDLVQVEQQLAEVQSEIDSAQSDLAVKRVRVATSTLILRYTTEGVGVGEPLRRALFEDSGRILAGTLTVMVTLASYLLPWGALGGLGWFLYRRGRAARPTDRKPAAKVS